MRKPRERDDELDLRRYDWSKATRGRFASRFARTPAQAPVAVRVLSDDLVEAFPDSASVNAALHAILAAAKHLNAARKPKRAA